VLAAAGWEELVAVQLIARDGLPAGDADSKERAKACQIFDSFAALLCALDGDVAAASSSTSIPGSNIASPTPAKAVEMCTLGLAEALGLRTSGYGAATVVEQESAVQVRATYWLVISKHPPCCSRCIVFGHLHSIALLHLQYSVFSHFVITQAHHHSILHLALILIWYLH
jgi:hypothetical protein